MSKSSNVRAAARRCGQVISACCGDSLRTHQWTLPLKKVVKLKETFWAWMTQETPELGILSDCEKTCEDFMNLIDTSSVEVCLVYGQAFPQVWRPDRIPCRGHWGSQEATQWQGMECGWESGPLNLKPLFSAWKWYIAPFRVGGKLLPQAEEFN